MCYLQSLAQDVATHQNVLDSMTAKTQQLDSDTATASLQQLNSRYAKLKDHIKERGATLEEAVNTHQMFSDTYGQCSDWMQTQMNKLAVCAEPVPDRHSLRAKLDLLLVGVIKFVISPHSTVLGDCIICTVDGDWLEHGEHCVIAFVFKYHRKCRRQCLQANRGGNECKSLVP